MELKCKYHVCNCENHLWFVQGLTCPSAISSLSCLCRCLHLCKLSFNYRVFLFLLFLLVFLNLLLFLIFQVILVFLVLIVSHVFALQGLAAFGPSQHRRRQQNECRHRHHQDQSRRQPALHWNCGICGFDPFRYLKMRERERERERDRQRERRLNIRNSTNALFVALYL